MVLPQKLLFNLILEYKTEFRILKVEGSVLTCRIQDRVGAMDKGTIPSTPRDRYASIQYPTGDYSTVTDLISVYNLDFSCAEVPTFFNRSAALVFIHFPLTKTVYNQAISCFDACCRGSLFFYGMFHAAY